MKEMKQLYQALLRLPFADFISNKPCLTILKNTPYNRAHIGGLLEKERKGGRKEDRDLSLKDKSGRRERKGERQSREEVFQVHFEREYRMCTGRALSVCS